MHRVLVERADRLAGCSENSDDEADLIQIGETIETYEAHRLARSNGKILELMRAAKAQDGDRNKKLLQFLNELGARALRMHLGRLLG